MNSDRSLLLRFLITFLVMTGAILFQLWLWPVIAPTYLSLFFPAAILISCLYGEGYSSIIIAAVATQYFFVPPYDIFTFDYPRDYIRAVVFIPSALLIKAIADNLIKLQKKNKKIIASLQEEKELREKFVSTLSHDLQTPLTSMRLAVKLMMKDRNDKESFIRNSQRLILNTNRLENMIKDLLDANKIRAGKLLPIEVTEMDLNNCISTTLQELNSIYTNRFSFEKKGELKGYWSTDAIQRILENLCTNAVKYGLSDTPISISAEQIDNRIFMTVHNFGPVIEQEEQEYLFEAFQRSRSAHLGKKKGWGLGLTLVKGLTEAMNGKVSVSSDENTGTIFKIELPVDSRIISGQ